MWKITNEDNLKKLNNFRQKIIIPFFRLLINASIMEANGVYKIKHSTDIWKSIEVYKKFSSNQQDLIDYTFARKINNVKFCNVFLNIVKKYSTQKIYLIFKAYISQNYSTATNKDYSIEHRTLHTDIYIILIDFLYEKFINNTKIWSRLMELPMIERNFIKTFTLRIKRYQYVPIL